MQRQYSGTAGRRENCQIGTFLAYASRHGRALIDRELYMPASWINDLGRCRQAAVPKAVEFATKPQQAQMMIARAIAAGVPFGWVTADEVYGQAKYLQRWLEELNVFHVLAVRCTDTVIITGPDGDGHRAVKALVAARPSMPGGGAALARDHTVSGSMTGYASTYRHPQPDEAGAGPPPVRR